MRSATKLGAFARWFLDENVERLTKAFEFAASWCEFHNIGFVASLFANRVLPLMTSSSST